MSRPRLKFVVEGDTEEKVVKQLIGPHLRAKGFLFDPDGSSREPDRKDLLRIGGNRWATFERDVKLFLNRADEWVVATSMYDLYAIQGRELGIASQLAAAPTPIRKAEIAEAAMRRKIADERFVPHVSLFEIEALVFADLSKAAEYIPEWRESLDRLSADVRHLTPEGINDRKETAPSKRLEATLTFPKFSKKVHVAAILQRIGLVELRAKCPHFGAWLRALEDHVS